MTFETGCLGYVFDISFVKNKLRKYKFEKFRSIKFAI